jgi:hypothetical protein
MIISQIVDLCVKPANIHCDKKTIENTALVLDGLAAITLLVIGILFITGTIALSAAAGWALFGAGIVYAAAMALYACNRTRIHCSSS